MEWSVSNDWNIMVTRAVYGYCADTKERMESMKMHYSAHMSCKNSIAWLSYSIVRLILMDVR
jgi:hypothetical protein